MTTTFDRHALDPGRKPRRRGFTLTEVMVAVSIFTGVGYVLSLSLQSNSRSHETVVQNADSNDALRDAAAVLRDELRSARSASILADNGGAHTTLTLETAIRGADGAAAWGVFDRRLAVAEADCHRENWQLRYEVIVGAGGDRELVRRILDDRGDIQLSETLVDDVATFTVEESGDVWLVRLVTDGDEGRRQDEFDVRTRTQ